MEGVIDDLQIGFKGTMAALYSKDLGKRVYRGIKERAINGESSGGKSYGYDIIPRYNKHGDRISGERVINEEQATIVRRIFEDYARGKSPRKIAHELNAEGVQGQNGNTWSPNTIHGNRRRGTGILNNELYIGRQIWGKQTFSRDPDTGRTNGRLIDPSTWVITDVPHLRIIDDKLWNAVKGFQKSLDDKEKLDDTRRPPKLFSYLLKCGQCGGGYCKVSKTQYGCTSARNRGEAICTNRLTISENKLEEYVLGALRKQLMDPELCEVFCKEYTAHLNRIRMEHNASLNANRAELEKVERSIKKVIEAIKNGVDPVMIRDEANALQARKEVLQATLADKQEAPVYVHPNMAMRYHQEVQRLIASLNHPEHRDESAQLIRKLIERIVLTPNEDRSALMIDLHGELAGILRASAGRLAEHNSNPSGIRSASELTELQQIRFLAENSGNAHSTDTRRECGQASAPASFSEHHRIMREAETAVAASFVPQRRWLPAQQSARLTGNFGQHRHIGRRRGLGALYQGAELADAGAALDQPLLDMVRYVLAFAMGQEIEPDLLHVAGDARNQQPLPRVARLHARGG